MTCLSSLTFVNLLTVVGSAVGHLKTDIPEDTSYDKIVEPGLGPAGLGVRSKCVFRRKGDASRCLWTISHVADSHVPDGILQKITVFENKNLSGREKHRLCLHRLL